MRCLISLLLLLASSVAVAEDVGGELDVLTYNVHGLPGVITGDQTLERLPRISPLLEPFDVVGLQESFMDDGHALLTARITHPTRHRFGEALGGRIYGSGLALLARPRSVHTAVAHYEAFNGVIAAGSDGLASKGFQLVRLQLAPGVELDVYNSHMDASGGVGDQAARASQVAHLTRAMQSQSAGRAILFLGDTNLKVARGGKDGETLRRWQAVTRLVCACAASRARCCGRIDRVLYRSGYGLALEAKTWGVAPGFRWKDKPLSDHDPIRVRFRWERRPL